MTNIRKKCNKEYIKIRGTQNMINTWDDGFIQYEIPSETVMSAKAPDSNYAPNRVKERTAQKRAVE